MCEHVFILIFIQYNGLYFCFIVYLFISCKSKVSSKVRILRSLKINYFCVFRRKVNIIIKIKFILRE